MRDLCSRITQCLEAVRVEYFDSKRAVESLYVRVLRRAARFDEMPRNTVRTGPFLHRFATKFRAVVASNRCWLSMPFAQLLKHAYDTRTADAEVDVDRQYLAREIVDHVERSEGATVAQGVVHEIHRPAAIGFERLNQRLAYPLGRASATTATQRQPLLAIQPARSLVIDQVPFLS